MIRPPGGGGWPGALGIGLAGLAYLDGAGSAVGFGQRLPFFQSFLGGASQDLSAGGHVPSRAAGAGELHAGSADEIAHGILAILIVVANGDGDEVFRDELEGFFGPETGRTAHAAARASARPDAGGPASRQDEEGLPLRGGLLAGRVQVNQPRDLHPARLAGLRPNLLVELRESLSIEFHLRRRRRGLRGQPVNAPHQHTYG